ncbi:MAG: polyprenyl synthetase family protein [Myxococcota bacterium]
MRSSFLTRRLLRSKQVREFEQLAAETLDRLSRIDVAMGDLLSGEGAPPGFQPHHYLAPGVPRIRPMLVLLSVEAARRGEAHSGADPQRAEDLAAAAELLHLAIAVHDAALGRQGGRRRRAARRLVGGAVGWLGGHHLTLRALEITRNEGPEILGDLLDALREAAEGHALSQTLQGRPATVEQAMRHAENHTGAVFSFACRAGARLAGADRAVVSGLGRYGRHAGVAWHLAEDLALLTGEERMDDAIEDRATAGRPMLAVSLAAKRDPNVARLWRDLSQGESPELVPPLIDAVVQLGAIDEGRRQLHQSAWTARRALNALPPSPHREALDLLVSGLRP